MPASAGGGGTTRGQQPQTASTEHASKSRAGDARERLLAATLRCAVRDGGGALSLQAIAREAAVSKALILYHFRDKEALLASAIRWLDSRIQSRESRALADSSAATVLEDYWRWIDGELTAGEHRALLELSQERGEGCRQAVRESVDRRRQQAEATIERVFSLLELTPRLPAAMLATCELAFREGLVLGSSPSAQSHPDRSRRVAFDVFWLSLLSLTR
jgi:AcrR family transcriptional regulator